MKERWIANIGLCAVAGVFGVSVSVLSSQGVSVNGNSAPAARGSQIKPGNSSAMPEGHIFTHAQDSSGDHSDAKTASL